MCVCSAPCSVVLRQVKMKLQRLTRLLAVAAAFATCNYDKSSRFECDALWQGQTAHQLIPFPVIIPLPHYTPSAIVSSHARADAAAAAAGWGLVRQKCISSDIYEVRRVSVLSVRRALALSRFTRFHSIPYINYVSVRFLVAMWNIAIKHRRYFQYECNKWSFSNVNERNILQLTHFVLAVEIIYGQRDLQLTCSILC